MYGAFHPGGRVDLALDELEAVHQEPSLALFRRRGSSRGTLSERDGALLTVFGELHNVQDVWPASDGSGDDLASLHELVWSPDALERLPQLDGSFFLAAVDPRRERLRLVADRYGTQKVFYGIRDGTLFFFPHASYFLDVGFRTRIDQDFLLQYLTFKWVVDERSVLGGVFPVPYGSVVDFSADGIDVHRYWAWRFDESREDIDDLAETARRWGEMLVRSTERRTRGKSRVIVALSGGLDSRAVLGALLECRPADGILAATYGTPGSFDYEFGHRAAEAVGVEHRLIDLTAPHDLHAEFLLRALDADGQVDVLRPFLTEWRKLLDTSEHILPGFMGDVLSGRILPENPFAERPACEADALRDALRMWRFIDLPIVSRLLGMKPRHCEDDVLAIMARRNHANDHRLVGNYVKAWDIPARQVQFGMEEIFMLREDFNYISVFLDNAYVDLALSLPVRQRMGEKVYKKMLSERFPRLFGLPTTNLRGASLLDSRATLMRRKLWNATTRRVHKLTGRIFPRLRDHRERVRRQRIAFIDHKLLMATPGPFQSLCADKLERLVARGILDGEAIRGLWHDHSTGAAMRTNALVVLVSLEFVLEAFHDRLR